MPIPAEIFQLLLITSVIAALLARRVKLPYTVGLVIAGAILAVSPINNQIEFDRELIYSAILPPLLFEAAYNLRWENVKKSLLPIVLMAFVGVLISAGFTAWGMTAMMGWPIIPALTFGFLIAATDPVSVIAMIKESKVTGRIRTLIEGESLLNDGVAAVGFVICLQAIEGQSITAQSAVLDFFRIAFGGMICGGIAAWAALFLVNRTEDYLVEILITTVTAFGSFLLAEHFHFSGVLATVTAGMVLGSISESRNIFSEKGHLATEQFWDVAAFFANSLVFLLIGVRLANEDLGRFGWLMLGVILIVLIGRALAVYPISASLVKSKHRIPIGQQHVLFWGGLRGALALALVLAIPSDYAWEGPISAAACGVVAFSVIVQGITMPMVLKRLPDLNES